MKRGRLVGLKDEVPTYKLTLITFEQCYEVVAPSSTKALTTTVSAAHPFILTPPAALISPIAHTPNRHPPFISPLPQPYVYGKPEIVPVTKLDDPQARPMVHQLFKSSKKPAFIRATINFNKVVCQHLPTLRTTILSLVCEIIPP